MKPTHDHFLTGDVLKAKPSSDKKSQYPGIFEVQSEIKTSNPNQKYTPIQYINKFAWVQACDG